MPSTEEYINKLPSTDSNSPFIIHTIWNSELIIVEILISSPNYKQLQGYCGTISLDSLKETANLLEIPYENFMSEYKNAICTDDGLANFQYEWHKPKFLFRKITESGLKILYGSIILLTEELNLNQSLLINTINKNIEQKQNIDKLNNRLDCLQKQHDDFTKTFEQCVREKNELETELMTKFLELLNGKKSKILELKKKIQQLTDKLETQSSNTNQEKCVELIKENRGISFDRIQQQIDDNYPSQTSGSSSEPTVPKRKRNLNIISEYSNKTESVSDYIIKRKSPLQSDSPEANTSIYDCATEKLLEEM